MAERQEAIVQLIDEHAWERAEVLPIGAPIPLAEWLGKVEQLNMTLAVLPPRRIADSSYRGGWVISADNARGRLYFVMTAEAFEQFDMGVGRDV
jgi:hypothetical protein